MAEALRPLRLAALLLMLLFWGAPFVLALPALLAGGLSPEGWQGLASVPHLVSQLSLSVWIGTTSTLLAVLLSLGIVTLSGERSLLRRWLAGMLALPHLAFAIGFGFLIMPAGLMTRLLQFDAPPQWVTTQDPYGVSLIAALALKETPFLLWLMFAALARPDFGLRLAAEKRVAASLGHGSLSTALRIEAPQLLRQVRWPIAIVWAYGCSVIDMAVAIGPLQPAPFQLSVWHDLNDASSAINSRGLAGALLLVFALLGVAFVALAALKALRQPLKHFMTRGPSAAGLPANIAKIPELIIFAIYGLVLLVLIIIAFSQRWPFPQLLPEAFSAAAWHTLSADPAPLLNSLSFGVTTSIAAMALAILWFEAMPRSWDSGLGIAAMAALTLPSVALASGQYVLFLKAGISAGWWSAALAQLTPVFAYVFIVLRAPYRDFDERYRLIAHGLNAGALRFFFRIKGPLLLSVLLSAAAIGFAVSIAQYVPVQLIGGGTTPTLTTEAVTLASGGNRPLLAAHALALMMLPAAVFGLAAWAGGQRHA